jgi:uncharacterized protein DUF5329
LTTRKPLSAASRALSTSLYVFTSVALAIYDEIVKGTWLLLALSQNIHRQFVSAILIVTFAGQTLASESLEQTVHYLIDYVAKSDAMFIRNGVSHTPAEAVDHIQAKYEHFKNQIKTPEDFIRLAASKSLLTGKPYLVRAPNGKETRLDVWLTDALKEYRASKHE